MVPQKGLEPPLPFENMDLNHARLPIPPLRHKEAGPDWQERLRALLFDTGRGPMGCQSEENFVERNVHLCGLL